MRYIMTDTDCVNFFRLRLTDFDQIVAEARNVEMSVTQLDSGPFESDAIKFKCRDVLASATTANRRLRMQGSAQALIFLMVDCPLHRAMWNGQVIRRNQLVFANPGGNFDFVTPPGVEVVCISLIGDAYKSFVQEGGADLAEKLRDSKHPVSCNPVIFAQFRDWIAALFQQFARKPAIDERTASHIEQEITRRLAACVVKPLSSKWGKRPSALRKEAVKRLEDHLAMDMAASHSVSDLCRMAKVSRRTLEYACEEFFGTSPKKFVKAQRLNAVRQDLIYADGRTSRVADIARARGFSHMGQFAMDYKRFFGELPSRSLRRNRSVAEFT